MLDEKCYWVGFSLVRGIGPVRLQGLLASFGSLSSAWTATSDQLQQAGIQQRVIESILETRNSVNLEEYCDKLHSMEIAYYTPDDEGYPVRLKNISHPPPVIYLKGEYHPEDYWAVGIVGTRRITSYGRQVTEQVTTLLARQGITIVSGLARGVDGVAHNAALQAGGRTIAVLGSGVDQIYPPEHRQLAEKIITHGIVMSDYSPGTQPDSANFPPRNRIISGLSAAVVVVEAGETSGALITASFAADQGKDVYAVPGGIYSPQSKGTNRLLRDGAIPLLDANDILNGLDITKVDHYKQASLFLPADDVESMLLNVLNLEPMHIDEIVLKSELPIDKVSASLTMMELKGLVRQLNGMTYQSIREEFGLI